MAIFEFTGTVKQVFPAESVTFRGRDGETRTTEKQVSVYEMDSDNGYHDQVAIEDWNVRLQAMEPGDRVRVRFSAKSREHNGRWYHDLRLIQITGLDAAPAQRPATSVEKAAAKAAAKAKVDAILNGTVGESPEDDLPF